MMMAGNQIFLVSLRIRLGLGSKLEKWGWGRYRKEKAAKRMEGKGEMVRFIYKSSGKNIKGHLIALMQKIDETRASQEAQSRPRTAPLQCWVEALEPCVLSYCLTLEGLLMTSPAAVPCMT